MRTHKPVGTGATAITITPSADAIATVTHARQDADTARCPTTSPASSHPESWIQEELCSISPASTPSPVDAPEDPVTPPSIKAWYVQRNSTGTQTVEWWSPTHRVRRRVFGPHLRRLIMYPPVREAYGSHVDIRRQRRLCDCVRCVRHQQAFLDHDVVADPPSMAGIRFLRLPGSGRRAVRRRRGPAWTPICVTIQRRSWSRVVAVTVLYTGSLQLHGCRCAN